MQGMVKDQELSAVWLTRISMLDTSPFLSFSSHSFLFFQSWQSRIRAVQLINSPNTTRFSIPSVSYWLERHPK
jgi:hypothetical protein